jgi:putative FmdB family regulatory protein
MNATNLPFVADLIGYTYAPVFGGKMPFYEYRCSACGHELEVLQKISDKQLVDCPSCGKVTLLKLVSAAGFQLKGSGWYVTDFKDGTKGKKDKGDAKSNADAKSESSAATSSDSGGASGVDKSADSSASSKKDDSKSSETTKTGTKSGASTDSTSK